VVIIGPPGEEVTIVLYDVTIPDHVGLPPSTWVLPTEDEWYKAAYYKAGGTAAGYWDYATQTDKWPDNNPPWLDSGNSVNFENPVTEQYAIGPPYYLNDGGAYALSEGPYGTYDQDGNLAELTETLTYSIYGDPWVRGGYWDLVVLPSYVRYWTSPHDTRNYIGFRVGMVPEPATIGWLAVGWLLLRRRRRAMGRCG
jgi:formylglycine-generating enzyme required for sulfatase activity